MESVQKGVHKLCEDACEQYLGEADANTHSFLL